MAQVKVRYCKPCMHYRRAVKLQETLKEALGVDAVLEEGAFGEFSIWHGDDLVAKRTWKGFAREDIILDGLRSALGASA